MLVVQVVFFFFDKIGGINFKIKLKILIFPGSALISTI